MRVLFIGTYRDFSGWSRASEDYILSLDQAGIDVVPRCCRFNYHSNYVHPRVLELEKKDSKNCDICIQQTLPLYYEYNGVFNKCIGIFCTESSDYIYSNWVEKLNLMDENWVCSKEMKEAAVKSKVTKPIKILPYATDVEKYSKSYKRLESIPENTFNFYTIGAVNRRKNLQALIQAFHLEFDPTEPVSLIVKATQPGMSKQENYTNLREYCDSIKFGLGLYPKSKFYKEEILITDNLSDEDISRLHISCDCGVWPSYSEAFGYPALDSMGFGRTPIVTNYSGFVDYIDNNVGWLVDYQLEPIFGMNELGVDIYRGSGDWASIDIKHLRKCMREAYENEELRKGKSNCGIDKAFDFSYFRVGELLKKALLNEEKESSQKD